MIQQTARSFPFKYLVLLISRYHSLIFSIRMPKIKRTTLTNKQKLFVLKYKDSNPNATHVNVGQLLKQNDIKECENVSNSKRSQTVQYPDLENAMYEWVIQYQTHVTLTDEILKEKAKQFVKLLNISEDKFKFLTGWLAKFKKRHNITKVKRHGESASADHAAVDIAIPEFRELLAQYNSQDMYNMDETGLFYRYSKVQSLLYFANNHILLIG